MWPRLKKTLHRTFIHLCERTPIEPGFFTKCISKRVSFVFFKFRPKKYVSHLFMFVSSFPSSPSAKYYDDDCRIRRISFDQAISAYISSETQSRPLLEHHLRFPLPAPMFRKIVTQMPKFPEPFHLACERFNWLLYFWLLIARSLAKTVLNSSWMTLVKLRANGNLGSCSSTNISYESIFNLESTSYHHEVRPFPPSLPEVYRCSG